MTINSDTLHGSIALKGALFDDLSLAKYRETLDMDSPDVTLFSPNGDDQAYFTQVGWLSPDGKTKVPDQHTLWQADKATLKPGDTVTLRWNNGEGVTFIQTISLDDQYMFTINQRVENHSGHDVSLTPYAYINRAYELPKTAAIIHEGPLGVMSGTLNEVAYKELHDKGNKVYEDASGWFGITDKYWLAALAPEDHFKVNFSHYLKNSKHRYQVDYSDGALAIADGSSSDYNVHLFAGAKELKLLDRLCHGDPRSHMPPIPLFDRAIDFGVLYFLTKPMLTLLTLFHTWVGNFGVAILLLTIVVRLLLYPLANKAYHATAEMRVLQPEMMKIRERFADDQIAMHKATREFYKREKVNPASGCLPVLIQMPVFFALYKVLYVSIEMRHAPFIGWIKDLSAPDPLNIFTGFGLVPWDAPLWLRLGILPMLMCVTMVIQMKQQPKPADPVQAKMMNFMPYFFLFIFAKMPAGLVLYWTWSNTLSIIQQRVITSRHGINAAEKAGGVMSPLPFVRPALRVYRRRGKH